MISGINKSISKSTLRIIAPVLAVATLTPEAISQETLGTRTGEVIDQSISDMLVDPNDPFGKRNSNRGRTRHICQIVIINPGIMRPNIENTVLSSKEMGARAGTVQVSATNASYSLSIDAPLGFTAMPTGGAADVVMATSFSGTGSTSFSDTPGQNRVRLKRGTTLVEAHVSAKRPMNNPFPSGQYSTEITMRCE